MQIRASARWILVETDIMIAFDKKQRHIEKCGPDSPDIRAADRRTPQQDR